MPEQETTPVIIPNADPTTGIQIPANVPSDEWLAQQVVSPVMPGMAVQAPVQQTIDEEKELLQQTTGQIPITPEAERAPVAAATPTTGATQAVAQQENIEIERVQADQGVAQEGNVTPLSTVRGQLEQLMGDVESDDAPWADEAMRRAYQAMSARGMGNSSIAAAAITQAVLESALPIAQYDASVYGTMNIQNLRNRQETMLSNTAASNVAKNMNAKTANEVQMFMNTMRDGVLKFNSTQHDAMSKFNAVQGTETSKFNAAANNVANQFYAQMDDAAEKFNATNTLAISKTNAEWRRTINTANTAAVNTSNMVNAQNAFNMSQQAMADLWQRSRDVFNWANQSADNSKDRAFQMAMYSMQRADYMAEMSVRDKNDLWRGVGDFAHSLFSDVLAETNWFGGE